MNRPEPGPWSSRRLVAAFVLATAGAWLAAIAWTGARGTAPDARLALVLVTAGGVAGGMARGTTFHRRSFYVLPFLTFAAIAAVACVWYLRARGWVITLELLLPSAVAVPPFLVVHHAVERFLRAGGEPTAPVHREHAPRVAASTRGVLAYVLLVFALAWVPAWLLRGVQVTSGALLGTQLLASSALYAVTMGWQPLVAVWIARRWIDPPGDGTHALVRAHPRFVVVAIVAPIALTALAALVAWSGGPFDALFAGARQLAPEPVGPGNSTLHHAVTAVAVTCSTVALLWVQALGEEVGWRGYVLPRLMQRFGPWKGLVLHGVVWGAWYAPIILLATGGGGQSSLRGAAFLLTCALLGTLLGWLRLASRSIVPTATANAVLTIVAGLPFVLQGLDVGPRGAVFGPPGWVPMSLVVAAIALGPCRRAVATPTTSPAGGLPDAPRAEPRRKRGDRSID